MTNSSHFEQQFSEISLSDAFEILPFLLLCNSRLASHIENFWEMGWGRGNLLSADIFAKEKLMKVAAQRVVQMFETAHI